MPHWDWRAVMSSTAIVCPQPPQSSADPTASLSHFENANGAATPTAAGHSTPQTTTDTTANCSSSVDFRAYLRYHLRPRLLPSFSYHTVTLGSCSSPHLTRISPVLGATIFIRCQRSRPSCRLVTLIVCPNARQRFRTKVQSSNFGRVSVLLRLPTAPSAKDSRHLIHRTRANATILPLHRLSAPCPLFYSHVVRCLQNEGPPRIKLRPPRCL
ncbi:hypothetical protein M011DRAFT_104721 [Sporormia fimetaria CBS 119925]|uniref:Uncharacterized protein n=1 Tax=Sporormia fimetaria CBS 119925 TaxID=1340428 RepID=A0A6A6VKS0_9PLEO|nr:hypothetical protein M011DRAFT_104721 [Sporormia fimetaria CBS 119925]